MRENNVVARQIVKMWRFEWGDVLCLFLARSGDVKPASVNSYHIFYLLILLRFYLISAQCGLLSLKMASLCLNVGMLNVDAIFKF